LSVSRSQLGNFKYEIGDKLICEREENNPNDKFSVKLVLQRGNPGQCVGHVPIEFSKIDCAIYR
jgi:hypothetical protein